LNVTNTGGTFVARQGNVQFIFAANAGATSTTLQVGPSPLAPVSPALLEDTVGAIGRPTQTFANAVQYWVKYDPLAIRAGSTEASLRVYRLNNHRWTLVGGTVDTVNKVVKTTITSAGTYAVLASTVATAAAENAITFRMFDSPHTSWFRVSADFDPVKVETFNPGLSRGFSLFSPTGNSIAFARQQVNGFYEVMTANADGSNARRITSISASGFRDAVYAPDGKSIYFTYFVNQGTMIVARAFMDGAPITNYGSFTTSDAFVAINATQTTARDCAREPDSDRESGDRSLDSHASARELRVRTAQL
jgi:hypothetical protein